MRILLTCLVLLWPAALAAQDLSVLKGPGVIALMRHALAPGTGDPAEFMLGDCSTQGNLDQRGRDQARAVGAAGIVFDHVWTSQWCHCRDTADLLGLGQAQDLLSLNSHFAGRGDPARQTAETLARIASLPEGARVMLVIHYVNIRALTGEAVGSGEIVATRRAPDGTLKVLGRVRIAP